MKNVFMLTTVAQSYDAYYETESGRQIDAIEKEILSELLKNVTFDEMLELGCGTGHWTQFFINSGFKVTAVDRSKAMLEYAYQKDIDAEFLEGNAEKLPFADGSFPVVASVTMLEFVENRQAVLSEINRVLKPGGYLLLGCLNADSVLGKNKQNDDTFREAEMLTRAQLADILKHIGQVKMKCGVYYTDDFQLLDKTINEPNGEPVFMGALVQKSQVK